MDRDNQTSNFRKIFYRPVEIAIRWCGMISFETKILSKIENTLPLERSLASFPNIVEKIQILNDAIRNKELNYGCMGITISSGESVEQSLLTIRHNDLKRWLIEYHPSERPDFIFNQYEDQSIPAYSIEVYNRLVVELDISRSERERTRYLLQDLTEERDSLRRENAKLIVHRQTENEPNERAERSYLRLIGALISLLLGKSPSGKPYSSFTSQASIISVLTVQNADKSGFNKRSLEEKFSAANRTNEQNE